MNEKVVYHQGKKLAVIKKDNFLQALQARADYKVDLRYNFKSDEYEGIFRLTTTKAMEF